MAKSLYDSPRTDASMNHQESNKSNDTSGARNDDMQFVNQKQEQVLTKMELNADDKQSTLLEHQLMMENLEKEQKEQQLETRAEITPETPQEDKLAEKEKSLAAEGKSVDKNLSDIEKDRFGRTGADIDSPEYVSDFEDYSHRGRRNMARQAALDAQGFEPQEMEPTANDTVVREYTVEETTKRVYHDDGFAEAQAKYDKQFSNEYDVNGNRVYGNGIASDLTNTLINEADYQAGKPEQFDDIYETTRTVKETSPDGKQAGLDVTGNPAEGKDAGQLTSENQAQGKDISSNKAVADLMAKYQADSEAYQAQQASAPQPEDFMPKSKYI